MAPSQVAEAVTELRASSQELETSSPDNQSLVVALDQRVDKIEREMAYLKEVVQQILCNQKYGPSRDGRDSTPLGFSSPIATVPFQDPTSPVTTVEHQSHEGILPSPVPVAPFSVPSLSVTVVEPRSPALPPVTQTKPHDFRPTAPVCESPHEVWTLKTPAEHKIRSSNRFSYFSSARERFQDLLFRCDVDARSLVDGKLKTRKQQLISSETKRVWEPGGKHLAKLHSLSFVVLDEADCMVESGHFRELQSMIDLLPVTDEGKLEQWSKEPEYAIAVYNLFGLIQELKFEAATTRVKATPDEEFLIASGIYPPQVKVYELSQLAWKFERHLDSEKVDFEILDDEFSQLAFLCADRSINLHAKYGKHHSLWIPRMGRDMTYDCWSCDLLCVVSSPNLYRINLEQGRFFSPLNTQFPALNVVSRSNLHGLVACGGEDGAVKFFDMRMISSAARINVVTHGGYAAAEVTSIEFDGIEVPKRKIQNLESECKWSIFEVLALLLQNKHFLSLHLEDKMRLSEASSSQYSKYRELPCYLEKNKLSSAEKDGLLSGTSGVNPISLKLKRGIDKTVQGLIEELLNKARPVKGDDDIIDVASISAGNDDLIGTMIADAIDKVGPDGVLSIKSSSSFETTVEVEEGMEIDRGYISPQFVTNPEKLLVEFENARVLITNQKITAIKDIIPILEKTTQLGASKDELQARISQLKKELVETDSVYDSEKLAERMAKLSGGVAVIKVGAPTETELEDRKLRIEYAKNAKIAAIEEGIVPGGGVTLMHLSTAITAITEKLEDADEYLGADIVQKALVVCQRFQHYREFIINFITLVWWLLGSNVLSLLVRWRSLKQNTTQEERHVVYDNLVVTQALLVSKWEPLSCLVDQFLDFNLEDKVSLFRGSIDRLRVPIAMMKRKQRTKGRNTTAKEKKTF